jgi:hypothetical protein
MAKKWTIESARAYVAKVQRGKQQIGLTYYSAMDYLLKNASCTSDLKVNQNDNVSNDIG